MLGGGASEAVPEAWRAAVAGDRHPELALLAIAAQADLVALRRRPSGALEHPPVLPALGLPPLPEQHRASFRRLVAVQKSRGEGEIKLILHLMANRGCTVHPADHMPRSFGDLPPVYSRWANWRDRVSAETADMLTEETWDAWWPAERRDALQEMRAFQPDTARALIAARAGDLPAEQRLAAVSTLATGLSAEDADYLRGLDSDRSGKVRALARALLARLGEAEDDPEALAEFAAYFTVGKRGLIRREVSVTAAKLKTNAQKARRKELSQTISLSGLARALGLDQVAFVQAWEVTRETMHLVPQMVAETGSDASVAALAARVGTDTGLTPAVMAQVGSRLSPEARKDILPKILAADAPDFIASRTWAAGQFGRVPLKALTGTKPYAELRARVLQAAKSGASQTGDGYVLPNGLFSLGLLADPAAAQAILADLAQAGLFAADPALGLLAFNAKLPIPTAGDTK